MSRKRTLALLCTSAMAFSCLASGCSKNNGENGSSNTSEVSKSNVATNDDGSVEEELTALELQVRMGNGINLGNTMEAYTHYYGQEPIYPEDSETAWGQPTTTQEMIDGMKAIGFDSLRIPVAWTNAMSYYEDGDYTIDESYLDRVEEIVNYGLNADMYVIINDHWDGSWWGMFGSASEETRAAAMEMYKSMWSQIADRFQNYSDKLIFESANEELGDRLNDKDVAADSGSLNKNECYEKTNEINQAFVDLIRSTGGNNAKRFLLIAGYNTDITMTCDDRFKMPTDSAKDKLLLSVHYYTPWDYCGTGSLTQWGSVLDYDEQNGLLEKLTKFTDQGYGVVIGEYAVLTESSTPHNDTDKFYTNFLYNCDLYGYCPMLWDCNNLYSRNNADMPDATMKELFKKASYENDKDLTNEQIRAEAQAYIDEAYKIAQEEQEKITAIQADENTAVAWIMYQSSDYAISYSVGDVYDPTAMTNGIIAENVVVDGEGEYTVSLDLSNAGNAKGFMFSALGIANGEVLFPGYIATLKEVLINGEPVELVADGYTSSDDKKCTRVNLVNDWVTAVPDDARIKGGDLSNAAATILNVPKTTRISTISITFTFEPGE